MATASKDRSDSGYEFVDIERLRDVVVAAERQTANFVCTGVSCGEKDRRRVETFSVEPCLNLKAIDPGQLDIQQHEIRTIRSNCGDGRFAGCHGRNLEALVSQDRRDQICQ